MGGLGSSRKEDDETEFKYVLLVFVSHFPAGGLMPPN